MPRSSRRWPKRSPIAGWWSEPRRSATANCSTRCASVEYGGRLIRKRLAAAPVALLFGSEKFGLSNDDLSYCHWLLRIGTEGSMNLGQAVAVCLYELVRNPAPPKPDKRKPATAEELDRLTTLLTEVLEKSGYVHTEGADAKIRRLVRRLESGGPRRRNLARHDSPD